MFKLLNLILLALFFSACSSATYNFAREQKALFFKTNKDEFYKVQLSNPLITPTSDRCSLFSSTLQDNSKQYGKLFVENVSLDSNCFFTQDSFWAFAYEFRENLRLSSFEKVEFKAYNNYEFYTFEIDKQEYVNFIFVYSPFEFTFLVDYEGKLSSELLSIFDSSYKSKYLNSKRFSKPYNHSLVRVNFYKGYFSRSSEKFTK